MTTGVERPSRPSTVGGMVHGGTVLVLLLVIATLALVVKPPAPPGIAEFAPRATETIDEALKQQASQFGTGDGGDCGAGQQCAAGGGTGVTTTTTTLPVRGPAPKKPVIDELKVKGCVGDPPRQTEDPQSPPCINYWEGDNGGATSKGVTAQEIRVAYVVDSTTAEMEDLARYFNERYQFYGRRIRLVAVSPTSSTNPDPKAAAVAVDTEAGAFAALDVKLDATYPSNGARPMEPYFEELARRHVIGIAGQTRRFRLEEMKAMAPYYWSYDLGLEDLLRHTAALICHSLHDRPARHAGADLQLKRRKFAVLYHRVAQTERTLGVLDEALDRECGERADRYEISDGGQQTARALQMRDSGITSVIFMTNPATATDEMQGYRQTGFYPELIQTGFSRTSHESQYQINGDASSRSHMFGVGSFNRHNPLADEPLYWAMREADPDDAADQGGWGDNTHNWYRSLLLLASGIQMAGPNLTPTTFAEGLAKTRFPNPGAGAAPYWQAHVGFGPNDYTMVDDVTAVWWDDTAPSYRGLNARGGWCYVNRGARFSKPRWPSDIDDRFFQSGTCR